MITPKGQPSVITAKAIYEGKVISLKEAINSRGETSKCHFFEPTFIGDFILRFRIDWSDLSELGDPKLDADIWRNGVKYHDKNGNTWHWTDKSQEDERYMYIWRSTINELEDLSFAFKFKLEVKRHATTTGKASIISPNK